MDMSVFHWTREPKKRVIQNDKVEITTLPRTDLWQRTYYHFRNDNAPVLQTETDERYFSFIVKTDFSGSVHRFDQCGVVMYLDSENWLKASVEYENGEFQHLGSVVTNGGYSDWATTEIPGDVKSMWYRLSRRGTITVLNVPTMASGSVKCVSAIWKRGMEQSGLESTPVPRRIRRSRRSLPICE